MDLQKELNDSQRAAVEYMDGPQLVIAGAGSGKTRVLTYKIAYILEKGISPWNILALTFTNKAAREMKERIGKLVGESLARQLHMGTFHSVFSRILRSEAVHLGYQPSFTIYDEADSRSLIKNILKEMGLDDKTYKPAAVHSAISNAKNMLVLPAQYAMDHEALRRDALARMPELYKVYATYCQRCQQANAMDFDDLLVKTFQLFQQFPEICQKYASHFLYVLVDEYQDTNFVQQKIVLQLTRENQHVCVVGDDAQSIYAFRGARIDNILNFQKIYPSCRLFKLEQNYRSTKRIVLAANSLIKRNRDQIPKELYSENEEGEKLVVKESYSDDEEATIVCNDIKKIMREEHASYDDFAILYRTNAQSRKFEELMRKPHVDIPYRIFGGLSFYQRKEIKDVIAYLRLVANPDDETAFLRIINYPARGIGNTTVSKVAACAREHGVSLWRVIADPVSYHLDVNKGTLAKLNLFKELISHYLMEVSSVDVYTLGQDIIKTSGISSDIFNGIDTESISRQENLQELLNGMSDFVAEKRESGDEDHVFLNDYLQDVALMTDLDSDDDSDSKVSLMTVHAAKGLEFPYVFIVGMDENIFPSQMSMDNLRGMEEERRLLYVAITRAEKRCILTCARNRYRYGKPEYFVPSRFIKDIDSRYVVIENETDPDDRSGRYFGAESAGHLSRYRDTSPCDEDIDRPYTGSHPWGPEYAQLSNRMQNSRPVASQFRADPKPKITAPRRPEQAVDPFSESFKRTLAQHGGNLRRITHAMTQGGRTLSASSSALSAAGSVKEGDVIEHQRFGIGTVLKVEGTGENAKATVQFKNTGTKQLLLKFAKFNILS